MTSSHTQDPRILTFWQEYLATLPSGETKSNEPPRAWHFMNTASGADTLGDLVLEGIKKATTSLYWMYLAESERVPEQGDQSIILNWVGDPLCLIRTTQVRILPFNEVDPEFAFDEGEGDRSLEYWRRVHWTFFSHECASINREPTPEMPVVCERFEVLYIPTRYQQNHAPVINTIQRIEKELEETLVKLEQAEQLENSLKEYIRLEEQLIDLNLEEDDLLFKEQQRVLAAVLLRQANILRQFGQREKAIQLSACELEAARLSSDQLTLARSLISYGATLIFSGEIEPGFEYLEQARQAFSQGDDPEFKQGLGWYWILRADLANAQVSSGGALEALAAAETALVILEPLKNWAGVSRAHAATAIAYEALGDLDRVEKARTARSAAEDKLHNESNAKGEPPKS